MNKEGHYNIFLDDYRSPMCLKDTRSWETVRSYKEFVKLITEKGIPAFISFDHDLSAEHYPLSEKNSGISNPFKIPYDSYKEKTGYHCAKWLVDYCLENSIPLPKYQVHSMNPIGKVNIIALLENFKSYQEEKGIE